VVRQALGSLLEQLRFLSELGLVAAVVVGLFDPMSAQSGAEQRAAGLRAAGLTPRPHAVSEPELARQVRRELSCEQVPILSFGPSDPESLGDRFAAIGALASELQTRRLVLVRRQGGLGPRSEDPLVLPGGHTLARHADGISVVNLHTDLQALLTANVLPVAEQQLLRHCQALLRSTATHNLTVSVTSPLTLLKELFTVRGAGTLIKVGTEIERAVTYHGMDTGRLQALLQASFHRRLRSAFFDRPPLVVYVERNYRGAAIVEPSAIAPYLSKFAVEPVAQGEGIGQDLWQALTRDHASLVWRSRPDNSIGAWYATVCHGLLRLADWHVFWRGLQPDQIASAVTEALARPNDFED
jgi:hypothetical protein